MISWNFIDDVLRGFGFPVYFVKLFMKCVTSTTFTIKVNGVGHGYFEGKRDLRQGDPMSPLLLLLVMKYLSRTLGKMGKLNSLKEQMIHWYSRGNVPALPLWYLFSFQELYRFTWSVA